MTLRPGGQVVPAHEGLTLELGYTRLRVVLAAEQTRGAFVLTEQPLEARALAGPAHTHAHEDGFIYVLSGRIGAQLGDEAVEIDRGGAIVVPRGLKHTFWNPTEEPAAVLELFSPAGLEGWFQELAGLVDADPPDLESIIASARDHGTELDLESLPELLERHGLHLPEL